MVLTHSAYISFVIHDNIVLNCDGEPGNMIRNGLLEQELNLLKDILWQEQIIWNYWMAISQKGTTSSSVFQHCQTETAITTKHWWGMLTEQGSQVWGDISASSHSEIGYQAPIRPEIEEIETSMAKLLSTLWKSARGCECTTKHH